MVLIIVITIIILTVDKWFSYLLTIRSSHLSTINTSPRAMWSISTLNTHSFRNYNHIIIIPSIASFSGFEPNICMKHTAECNRYLACTANWRTCFEFNYANYCISRAIRSIPTTRPRSPDLLYPSPRDLRRCILGIHPKLPKSYSTFIFTTKKITLNEMT